MLGKGHLLLGAAGWLAVGAPAAELLGYELDAAELAAGAVVGSGAAMLPDLDHPQATVSRSLGPLTAVPAAVLGNLTGGHRQGTHSLLFAALAALACALALALTSGPWVALGICFFFASLVVCTLTEADGAVCAVLSALVAATLITVAPQQEWIWLAVGGGCLLHMLGDVLTPGGVPPLWPLSSARLSLPVIGETGDWREKLVACACGLAACWLLATAVFAPLWADRRDDRRADRAVPVKAPPKKSAVGDEPVY